MSEAPAIFGTMGADANLCYRRISLAAGPPWECVFPTPKSASVVCLCSRPDHTASC